MTLSIEARGYIIQAFFNELQYLDDLPPDYLFNPGVVKVIISKWVSSETMRQIATIEGLSREGDGGSILIKMEPPSNKLESLEVQCNEEQSSKLLPGLRVRGF